MRWACVLLPQLALDAVLRGRSDPEAPLILLSGPAQRRLVQALNPAARALGLRAGQSLAAVLARHPQVERLDYEVAQVERWHAFLAAWAYRFSAQVSLDFPRAVVFEVQSSMGLFGPWPRFEARLRAELTRLGFRHRIVCAPNPLAARVLAGVHDGLLVEDAQQLQQVLAQLPIAQSGLPRETVAALRRMGLRQLGQLLQLPRAGVAQRFAPQTWQHLDGVFGRRPVALSSYSPPASFDARLELNFDVESHQALLFPVRRLTADLAMFLAARDGGVQRFTLCLEHADDPVSQVVIGLLSVERDPALLFDAARGRLEPLCLRAPVRAVRLRVKELPRFVPVHPTLFSEQPPEATPWTQVRERLRARLGDTAVQALSVSADHRPERAWQVDAAPTRITMPAGLPRPGWLLSQPVVLTQPVARILAGPERIESGWWDGGDIRRDYYQIETLSGQRGWAYRPVGDSGPWLLHGWFA
jgi:protein ImuB